MVCHEYSLARGFFKVDSIPGHFLSMNKAHSEVLRCMCWSVIRTFPAGDAFKASSPFFYESALRVGDEASALFVPPASIIYLLDVVWRGRTGIDGDMEGPHDGIAVRSGITWPLKIR
jgi:hypothetical protein